MRVVIIPSSVTRAEAAFRNRETGLCLRPRLHHQEARADAQVSFAALA